MSGIAPARTFRPRASCALAIATAGLVLACGPVRAHDYDLESGDYLTPEEYAQLSKDEAIAYCQRLAQEVDIQKDNADAAASMLAEAASDVELLEQQLTSAKAALEPLEAEVEKLERRTGARPSGEVPADAATYEVRPGDSLSRIARRIYGRENDWPRIHEGNRDEITNPDLIYPGQVLAIPR